MNDTQGAPTQTHTAQVAGITWIQPTSTTNTPSHKHVTFELSFLGSSSRRWRNSESHQLPFPSNFPAHLLPPSHTSPLAPSSFLVLGESLCAGKPPGFSASLSTFRKTWSPPFSFPECGSSPADSSLKTGSPWGQCRKWSWDSDRLWAWDKHFLNALPAPWPCPGLMPSLVPGAYLGTTATDRTTPAHLSARPAPSSVMGNCLYPVADDNSTKLAIKEDFLIDFPEDYYPDYNETDVEAAAPCHSCSLLNYSSLPFFILVSILGILASGTILYALLRPLFRWQLYQDRSTLVQLAVGSALFSIVVPILARDLSGALITSLCHLAHLVAYGSAFAQALLIGYHACLGPQLGAGQVPGLRLGVTVGLWGVAALLSLPVVLGSDTSQGLCTVTFSGEWETLRYIHAAACFAIFVLLPLGLLGTKGLKTVLGRALCPWVDVLWVWFIFWWPQGMTLGLDSLVRSKAIVVSTCPAQQALDMLLDVAEALAILHCVATPLLLAWVCYQATHTSPPSLPLPTTQTSHLDTLGGKS